MLRTAFHGRLVTSIGRVLRRSFATVVDSPIYVTKSKTGVTVVAVEDVAPAASVAVVVKAGSRLEMADNIGVAHYLKNFAFKNTTKRTAFRTTREVELVGGVLSANLTRENLILSAEFLPEDLPYFLEILSDTVTKTKYEPHEFLYVKQSVDFEKGAAKAIPEVLALDTAHAVAFRSGLGNSLFADSTSKVTSVDLIKAFASKVYTAPNITIVGTGVDSEKLASLTDHYFQDIGNGIALTPDSTKYFGGDSRISTQNGTNHFVLAFPGVGFGTNEFAALQVLRFVLDGEKHAKWGEGVSPLAQIANKHDILVTTFNTGYSDAGLFGVYIEGPPAGINTTAQVAVEQLKNIAKDLPTEDFNRAIAKAKFDTASSIETRSSKLEIYGGQAGRALPAKALLEQYSSIKASDVQNIAQRIIKSKPTAVAVGDTHSLPYADSLSL